MTYKQFVRASQRKQAAHISKEHRRMERAYRLWLRYSADMHGLGLHPLTGIEITTRQSELDAMSARLEETHGDSPTMRYAYEAHANRT
jgi:hypothetical protein